MVEVTEVLFVNMYQQPVKSLALEFYASITCHMSLERKHVDLKNVSIHSIHNTFFILSFFYIFIRVPRQHSTGWNYSYSLNRECMFACRFASASFFLHYYSKNGHLDTLNCKFIGLTAVFSTFGYAIGYRYVISKQDLNLKTISEMSWKAILKLLALTSFTCQTQTFTLNTNFKK